MRGVPSHRCVARREQGGVSSPTSARDLILQGVHRSISLEYQIKPPPLYHMWYSSNWNAVYDSEHPTEQCTHCALQIRACTAPLLVHRSALDAEECSRVQKSANRSCMQCSSADGPTWSNPSTAPQCTYGVLGKLGPWKMLCGKWGIYVRGVRNVHFQEYTFVLDKHTAQLGEIWQTPNWAV